MPHTGGRQECEHGEEAEVMGKGFEREMRICDPPKTSEVIHIIL